MKIYTVNGMSCAACSARVEKAVSAVDGVTSCSVSLLTNSMGVEGAVPPEKIIAAVEAAGYEAALSGKEKTKNEDKETSAKESKILLKRLLWSAAFLLPLMYISMGYTMWGFPLPKFLEESSISAGLAQLLLCISVMVINQKFFISGVKGIINRSPNMDTLVSLGAAASFAYSVYVLFLTVGAETKGDIHGAHELLCGMYFESCAMILTLITVGKMLEAYSKGKTTDALRGLIALRPDTATVLKDGREVEVAIEDIGIGDVFIVRAGEGVAVDGVVIKGSASVNESALTGESLPADKKEGDKVSSATICLSGYMECRAVRVGEDTTLSQIIKMVSDAQATKAPIAKIADKVSGVFVPAVMAGAFLTFGIWMAVSGDFGYSLVKGISVLVISCPCALGLATPVAIMVGSGKGAKNGILFKTALSLETAGKADIVVLDKTGTVTKGEMSVSDMVSFGVSENELLSIAASLEKKSEHPLGRAVVEKGEAENVLIAESESFETFSGNGVSATVKGQKVFGGNLSFVSPVCSITEDQKETARRMADKGKTPLYFARAGKLIGIIGVSDVIKEDSKEAVSQLQNMGIRVVMLTGDNEKTGRYVAEKVGISEVVAGVRPDGKEAVIKRLKEEGNTVMVGDGINDSPALVSAHTGIAIGAGADVAVDSADIVLVNSSLLDCVSAIRLSRRTFKNICENFFWAFIYNVIGIPLAAGAFVFAGLEMTPMLGAAAMSLSSFCVIMNALRLNLVDIKKTGKYRKIKTKGKKEKRKMETVMKIEGMMCPHCEARVKKCLEEIEGVSEAIVSHEKDEARVIFSEKVDLETLKKAVEGQGYKVL